MQRGCTSYKSLRIVNNVTYETFQDAYYALRFLADDKEFIDGIKETSKLASGVYLQKRFVTLLLSNSMSCSSFVWEQTWKKLVDGIIYERRSLLNNPDLILGNEELKTLCLIEIDRILRANRRSLKDYNDMPYPTLSPLNEVENILLVSELNYIKEDMTVEHAKYFDSLINEQRIIFYEVIDAMFYKKKSGFFFVYGYGGTSKTFIGKTLSTRLCFEGKIVLNVASSRITTLLLLGGRIAHSRFVIPLALNEESTCNIKQGNVKVELLYHASFIIWDKAPLVNKWVFEALDSTLRDIMRFSNMNCMNEPFSGKVVVLGGDFKQVLQVIPKANRANVVVATANSSLLWKSCKVLNLIKNMILQDGLLNPNLEEIKEFGKWILDIGDGNLGGPNDGKVDVEISEDLLILDLDDYLSDIVDFAYPNLIGNMSDHHFF